MTDKSDLENQYEELSAKYKEALSVLNFFYDYMEFFNDCGPSGYGRQSEELKNKLTAANRLIEGGL